MKPSVVRKFIIGIFCSLYILVSLISTVHVIDFFEVANPSWMAITLAVAFEIGAAASLASLVILDKMNKTLVWALFIAITLMQMQGNLYHAFTHLGDYSQWSELFWLSEEEPLFQKRVFSLVAAGILPLVALGFIKSLVDYIKPGETEELKEDLDDILDPPGNPEYIPHDFELYQEESEIDPLDAATKKNEDDKKSEILKGEDDK